MLSYRSVFWRQSLGLMLWVTLFLSGCGQPNQTNVPASGQTPDPASYPMTTQDTSPLPYPGASEAPSTTPLIFPTATVDANLGRLRGTLLLMGQPVVNYGLYLGELLKDESGQEAIVALDMATSPSTFTSQDGSFEIVNIAPGNYGLVLVTVRDSFHLLYPDRQESLIVRVANSQSIDLGILDYSELPINQP